MGKVRKKEEGRRRKKKEEGRRKKEEGKTLHTAVFISGTLHNKNANFPTGFWLWRCGSSI